MRAIASLLRRLADWIDPDSPPGNPGWLLEEPIVGPGLFDFWGIADRCLRPIRPDTEPAGADHHEPAGVVS